MDVSAAALGHAEAARSDLSERSVATPANLDAMRRALGATLPDEPQDPVTVIDRLVEVRGPGILASPGPRYVCQTVRF